MRTLRQHPSFPSVSHPISIIGCGAIVRYAHLPAYQSCGFQVRAIYDLDLSKAQALAADFRIDTVCESIRDLVQSSPLRTVYDLAVPAVAIADTLRQLPDGAFVLIQKPLGEDLTQAKEILSLCKDKGLHAAVNFQLRYAPYALAAKDLIDSGAIGEILEVDAKIHVHTPWELWDFLEKSPRMEIVYHSIHYIDFIRSLLGEPQGVKANTIKHPSSPKLHSSRSALLMDYGTWTRAQVVSYHGHAYGPKHQLSQIMIEGTEGAICFQMGLNMNYPAGESDWLEYCTAQSGGWVPVPLEGSWFPHAFRGTMSSMMNWVNDPQWIPQTHIEDAYRTMALVEAAYINAGEQGTPVPS